MKTHWRGLVVTWTQQRRRGNPKMTRKTTQDKAHSGEKNPVRRSTPWAPQFCGANANGLTHVWSQSEEQKKRELLGEM